MAARRRAPADRLRPGGIAPALQPLAVPIDTPTPDPRNARRRTERNLDALAASLQRFGQLKPLVMDADGVVRAGNGMLEAAKRLGWKEIAAVRVGLGKNAAAYALADNRSAELSEWQWEPLSEHLLEVEDVTELGWSEDEVKAITASFDWKGDDKGTGKNAAPTVVRIQVAKKHEGLAALLADLRAVLAKHSDVVEKTAGL